MAAPPPVLTLAVEKGPRKGEIRQCRAGAALRVGRVVKGNDLAVRDVGASQQHLAIEFLPPPTDRWAVSDLGSSNGTLLNGAPLVPSVLAPLSYGDLIKIGESTVLAVSISSDSDLNPGAVPGPRRSSRQAAAVVVVEEEKAPVVTRRGGRKKAAAAAPEIPEAENDEPDAAAVVVEEEKPRVVTRRGGRKKAAAAAPPEAMEEAAELTRRGARKKAAEPTEPQKEEGEEATVVTRRGGRKKTAEPPEPERDEEMEEDAPVVTRHGRQKKVVEPPELEKEEEEEEQEEEAPVVTRCGGRKKDEATVAYLPLPPKARSGRGRGRVTRAASTRKAVLEDEDVEEQEGNEVAASRERTGNSLTSTAVKSGEEKGDKVAVGDGEVEGTAKTLEEEVTNERASAHPAASDNGGEEEKGGGEEDDENGKRVVAGCGGDGEKAEGRARRSCLETMTLREWFERMEKYLPRMIDEAADEMIVALDERHRCIYEYISMLEE